MMVPQKGMLMGSVLEVVVVLFHIVTGLEKNVLGLVLNLQHLL